jgi:hypothetical protein
MVTSKGTIFYPQIEKNQSYLPFGRINADFAPMVGISIYSPAWV